MHPGGKRVRSNSTNPFFPALRSRMLCLSGTASTKIAVGVERMEVLGFKTPSLHRRRGFGSSWYPKAEKCSAAPTRPPPTFHPEASALETSKNPQQTRPQKKLQAEERQAQRKENLQSRGAALDRSFAWAGFHVWASSLSLDSEPK